MDYGVAQFIRTQNLTQQLLIVDSVRTPGFAYKFMLKADEQYECSSCWKFGIARSVTVRNGRIFGIEHPENGHHQNCCPEPKAAIEALALDREMRYQVRTTGKHPRDAYDAALSSIAKRFKSCAERQEVVARFPTYREVRRQLCRERAAGQGRVLLSSVSDFVVRQSTSRHDKLF